METNEKAKKLFTDKQLYLGTFLGGPIVAGIMVFKNFKRLGEPKKAELSILLTILFTVILFFTMFQLPDKVIEAIPSYLIPLINSFIIAAIFKKFQGKKIEDFFLNNGEQESNWKVAGITGIGLIVTLVIVFQFAFFQPPFPGDKLTFRSNEIYYEEDETSQKDVELLADALFMFGYFADDYGSVVHLATSPSKYTVTLPVEESFWDDQDIISDLQLLKSDLQTALGKKVDIQLEHYTLSGETKRKLF